MSLRIKMKVLTCNCIFHTQAIVYKLHPDEMVLDLSQRRARVFGFTAALVKNHHFPLRIAFFACNVFLPLSPLTPCSSSNFFFA